VPRSAQVFAATRVTSVSATNSIFRGAAHAVSGLLGLRHGLLAYGSTAVMFCFGTCPTGMRVTSFMDLRSTTDTEFDAALAT